MWNMQRPTASEERISNPTELTHVGHKTNWAAGPDETHRVSCEIEQAMLAAARGQKLIERLALLQDEAVQRLTGVGRAELCFLVWNAPMVQVANRLGLDKHVLIRICKLYDVPTPSQGYWQASIDRRPIRLSRVSRD